MRDDYSGQCGGRSIPPWVRLPVLCAIPGPVLPRIALAMLALTMGFITNPLTPILLILSSRFPSLKGTRQQVSIQRRSLVVIRAAFE
jgi:hypothetical protein